MKSLAWPTLDCARSDLSRWRQPCMPAAPNRRLVALAESTYAFRASAAQPKGLVLSSTPVSPAAWRRSESSSGLMGL